MRSTTSYHIDCTSTLTEPNKNVFFPQQDKDFENSIASHYTSNFPVPSQDLKL